MKQFTYTITDPLGIHARPAGLIAREAKGFGNTAITIEKDGKNVKATQLMMLMSLGVRQGDAVTVTAEGPEEDAAIAGMRDFFARNL